MLWSLSGWCSSSCVTFPPTSLRWTIQPKPRPESVFLSWSYQKIGAELFEGLWLRGELVLLWFKGWKAKRSPSLFCLKLHSFVRRRTTRGSSGSGFSHIKWISSSLFSICKLHFPDGASAPGCSRGTAKKRNEELCTEKTVTMRDNH